MAVLVTTPSSWCFYCSGDLSQISKPLLVLTPFSGGSFVSTTVQAGAGADTLKISTSTAGSTASTASSFYGGAGADLITASGSSQRHYLR